MRFSLVTWADFRLCLCCSVQHVRRDEHAHVENPLQVAGVARFGVVPIVRALCVCVCVCLFCIWKTITKQNETSTNKRDHLYLKLSHLYGVCFLLFVSSDFPRFPGAFEIPGPGPSGGKPPSTWKAGKTGEQQKHKINKCQTKNNNKNNGFIEAS